MTPEQYHKDAMRTAAGPEVFHYPKDETTSNEVDNEFVCDAIDFLKAAAKMDDWKSRLFYGKPKYQRDNWDVEDGKGQIRWLVGKKTDAVQFPDFDDYQEGEMSVDFILNPQVIHSILGLATEGAELVEDLLKLMRGPMGSDGGTIVSNTRREGGDISWYLEMLAVSTGTTVQQMRIENIERLRKRFPNRFTEEDAVARADERVDSQSQLVAMLEGESPIDTAQRLGQEFDKAPPFAHAADCLSFAPVPGPCDCPAPGPNNPPAGFHYNRVG